MEWGHGSSQREDEGDGGGGFPGVVPPRSCLRTEAEPGTPGARGRPWLSARDQRSTAATGSQKGAPTHDHHGHSSRALSPSSHHPRHRMTPRPWGAEGPETLPPGLTFLTAVRGRPSRCNDIERKQWKLPLLPHETQEPDVCREPVIVTRDQGIRSLVL